MYIYIYIYMHIYIYTYIHIKLHIYKIKRGCNSLCRRLHKRSGKTTPQHKKL